MAVVLTILCILTLRAPAVVPVLNDVDLSVLTLLLLLRLELIGISTASVPDAKADNLGWKAHNLHWKLYRRHW